MGTARQAYFLFFFVITLATQVRAQAALSGTVVDASGRALPLVAVRLVDAAGVELAVAFTNSRGAFRFARACDTCAAVVSLPGFNAARAPMAGIAPTRLTLTVAPVQESVVVSATRSETPTSQVGAAVTVFTAEDIERRDAPLVADLLRATPGVTVVGSGIRGAVTSLFVRGGESNYNAVLLDGVPLNDPGGTFNFGNLTTDFVERVEVVRGAQSALFGSDAMASVVEVISQRATRGLSHPSVAVSGEGGSYGSQRGAVSLGAARGVWDAVVHVGRQHTDNRAPNSAFDETTVGASGGAAPSANLSLRVVTRGGFGRTGTPGQTAFGRPDMDAFFRRRDGVVGATLDHQLSNRWQQRATYALSVSHQASTNLQIDPPYLPQFGSRVAPFTFGDFPYDSHNDLRRHYASYQADVRLGPAASGEQRLTLAVDVNAERGALADRLAGTTVMAARNNVGVTAQHQWLGTRVALSTGLRVERNASFGTAVAPRVSMAYMMGQTTKLKANAGRGVKEPTLIQSFSPSPSYLGNPDLAPERATTFDAGIEQRLFGQRLKIEAVWFDGRFADIISTRTLGFSPFRAQYFNIGLTKARGAELTADAAPVRDLRIRGSYTLVVSRIAESTSPDSAVFAAGSWAFRRPRHSGFVETVWTHGRASLDLRTTVVGRRIDSDFSALEPALLEAARYSTWDAGGSYRVSAAVALYGRVDNLGNRDYMEPLGYPAWQRSARAGAKVTW